MTDLAKPGTRALVAVPPVLREAFFPLEATAQLESMLRTDYRDTSDLAVERCDVDVLVTSWGVTPLTSQVLDRFPRLQLVAHTGGSVKAFVTAEMFDRGIAVTQAGAAMARPVAEVALTFTLVLLHQVHGFDLALRTGTPWTQAQVAPPQHELLGTRIGVVGASRVGRSYIGLINALGAKVMVCDPFLDDDEARRLDVTRVELDELLATCRVVSIHAPSLPETHHMIGGRELALMSDGAGIVNTARSTLVDEAALIGELRTGRLRAALDVFDVEPLPIDHPLRTLPNVVLTPHQAAATLEGRARQGRVILDEISRYLARQPLCHAVEARDLARMG